MKTIVGLVSVAAVMMVTVVPEAEARGRGGRSGFSGSRSYSVPRSMASRPALRQDWVKTPLTAKPVYHAKPAMTGVRGQTGGQFNNAFAGNYQRTGFNPTARQSSMFSNPWFWMAMMGGYSMFSHSNANAAAAQTQAEFEANCRAAVANPDKPANVTVSVDECAELARLAYAKVQAESGVSGTTVVSTSAPVAAPVQAPVVPVESSGWMLYLLGALILVPLGLGFVMRRK